MSRLIETMRISDGRLQNAEYHLKRIEESALAVFGTKAAWGVEALLASLTTKAGGTQKCRLVYDASAAHFNIDSYTIRAVKSLKPVTDNKIVYDHKYEDRTSIETLLQQKEDRDDILIVRDGKVTDVSYANIVFKKDNEWFTPDTFLLNGTMRQFLIDNKRITACKIGVDDITKYTHFKLINAMLAFEGPESEVLNIR